MKDISRLTNNEALIQPLVDKILSEIEQGRIRAMGAVESEKTITYWKIGRHIHDHLLNHLKRADYGSYLFTELAKRIGIGTRTLYWAVQLYETFPEIVNSSSQLTWTHFRILLRIKDENLRNAYIEKVIEEKLTVKELIDVLKEERIIIDNGGSTNANLEGKRGYPYTFQIKRLFDNNGLYVDQGFHIYKKLNEKEKEQLNEDDIVIYSGKTDGYTLKTVNNRIQPVLYSYKAAVNEIIDGDTINVTIDIGFENYTQQKIRMRGINAEDLYSEKGRKARDFVVSKLVPCDFIIIRTYWRDKYNRYLADIYYNKEENDIKKAADEGKYLNREMLDNGLAVIYRL
ncbi:MAG: thermonuclease family protein [Bacteroidales bacterium]|nr:thermonuclease family protein [Bacteroidales bacterium]